MSKKTFEAYCAEDGEMRRIKPLQETNNHNLSTTIERIHELEVAMERASDHRAMVNAILEGSMPAVTDVVGMRAELEQQQQYLKALEHAGQKISAMIETRRSALGKSFALMRNDERLASMNKIIDGMLSIAEANADELRIQRELRGEGVTFQLNSLREPFGRESFPQEYKYIERLSANYANKFGYCLTSEQQRRIKALAEQAQ